MLFLLKETGGATGLLNDLKTTKSNSSKKQDSITLVCVLPREDFNYIFTCILLDFFSIPTDGPVDIRIISKRGGLSVVI